LFKAKRTVVDKAIYRLSISASVPEIFVVKVKSCPKTHQIFDIFSSQILKGWCPPKVVPGLTPPPRSISRGKVL